MLEKSLGLKKYNELRETDNILYKALELSLILFKDDTDKGGLPYIIHLMYVYSNVETMHEKVVALLHDVIEDKGVKRIDLIDIGFSDTIVNDIEVLTRVNHMDYNKYIDNIIKKGSVSALKVKLADLTHNMNMSRIKNPTIKDYERVEKRYNPSYIKILNRLNEMEK